MRGEVQSAVEFLLNLLRCRNLEPAKLECFKQNLDKVNIDIYINILRLYILKYNTLFTFHTPYYFYKLYYIVSAIYIHIIYLCI